MSEHRRKLSVVLQRRRVVSGVVWLAVVALVVVPVLAVLGGYQTDRLSLSIVEGVLAHCDEAFCVDDEPLDFGPFAALAETTAQYDFDRDGRLESMFAELEGLVGSNVRLEVRSLSDRDVRVVNGLSWISILGPALWELPAPTQPHAETPGLSEHLPVSSPEPLPDANPPNPPAGGLETPFELTGVLSRCQLDWCVDDVLMNFGPWWYLTSTVSLQDYDDDGVMETLEGELAGLQSTVVEVGVITGQESNEVFELNGTTWRQRASSPPWAGGPLLPTTTTTTTTAAPGGGSEEDEEVDSGPPTTVPSESGTIPSPPTTGPPGVNPPGDEP